MPIAALFAASYAGFLLLLAVYLQVGLGMPALRAALVYTPNAVGFFAASLVAAPAARLLGRNVLALGYGLGALGLLGAAAVAATSGSALSGWELAVPLLMMALVGCLAYEFQVVLPVVAQETFAGDARTYGFLTAAMGLGAVVGGLYVAGWGRTGMPALVVASGLFGLAMLGTLLRTEARA